MSDVYTYCTECEIRCWSVAGSRCACGGIRIAAPLIDQYVPIVGGERTVDLGWGLARINDEDQTVTRTCKGCGVSVTSAIVHRGNVAHVVPVPFEHAAGCHVWRLGLTRFLGRS